jgi:large conductance mechanosensitive channel
MKKFIEDFKKFITRGNVIDMAVGVIVGGAFNTIVLTMNQKILMPIVNWALSYISKGSELCTVLPNYTLYDPIAHAGATPIVVNGVSYYSVNFINWSALIESVINFFFIALTLFVILRVFSYLSSKRAKLEEALRRDHNEENQ